MTSRAVAEKVDAYEVRQVNLYAGNQRALNPYGGWARARVKKQNYAQEANREEPVYKTRNERAEYLAMQGANPCPPCFIFKEGKF